MALIQFQRAKRAPKTISKIENRAGKNYTWITEAFGTATKNGTTCAGAPIKTTPAVLTVWNNLIENCTATAIMGKCNSAKVTKFTPVVKDTLSKCKKILKQFTGKYVQR